MRVIIIRPVRPTDGETREPERHTVRLNANKPAGGRTDAKGVQPQPAEINRQRYCHKPNMLLYLRAVTAWHDMCAQLLRNSFTDCPEIWVELWALHTVMSGKRQDVADIAYLFNRYAGHEIVKLDQHYDYRTATLKGEEDTFEAREREFYFSAHQYGNRTFKPMLLAVLNDDTMDVRCHAIAKWLLASIFGEECD